MSTPKFELAIEYAHHRLETELAPYLFYHNFAHTYEQVLPAAIKLGKLCGISLEEQKLLEVAASYHDIGFVQQTEDHEVVGAKITAQTLPNFGFNPAQIEAIVGMIMATRLPQSPKNILEQILADADLYLLGSDNFFVTSNNLRLELEAAGNMSTDEEWYQGQIDFLQGHTYFTNPAKLLRDPGKQRNVDEIKRRCRFMFATHKTRYNGVLNGMMSHAAV